MKGRVKILDNIIKMTIFTRFANQIPSSWGIIHQKVRHHVQLCRMQLGNCSAEYKLAENESWDQNPLS